jgi:thioredoxin-like negative regulator of GroEL
MANSIPSAMGYAKAACAMASAMAKNGERKTGEMFGQSWKNAQSMNEGFRKSEVLCELAASMAEAGDGRAKQVFKEARKAVFSLPKNDKWLEPSAVGNLFDAYVRARRIDQATALLDVAASTPSDRAARLRKLATFNAKRGRFEKALSFLEPDNLDDYIETLAEWGSTFEQSQSGMALTAWQKATQVAGWVRPDWEKICNLLSSGNS